MLFASPAMAQQAAISLSSGTTVPGGSVVLNVSLANSGGVQPAAVQWTIGYPLSDVASVSAAAGPGLSAPGKSLSCNTSNGSTICVAYGMNSNIIGNGVLATVTFNIATAAPDASANIQVTGVVASDASGTGVPSSGSNGTISISQPPPTWSISGTVSPAASGSGTTVTLSGAASASTTADASGNYTFSGLANGAYTVTPSKSGFTFTPANRAVTLSGANQTAINFTAQVPSWSISGTVSPAASGTGTTVTLSGAASASTTADASGNYTFSGLANGAYTVTPSKSGFTFTPANRAVTLNGANQTAINFTATSRCDLNNDGLIDGADVQFVLNLTLGVINGAPGVGDLNRDGFVNVIDLQILIDVVQGLKACPP
jgi:hypothetical protein